MRKLFLTLAASLMLISISACSDHGHSHEDESHPHDAPQHHDSINQTNSEDL